MESRQTENCSDHEGSDHEDTHTEDCPCSCHAVELLHNPVRNLKAVDAVDAVDALPVRHLKAVDADESLHNRVTAHRAFHDRVRALTSRNSSGVAVDIFDMLDSRVMIVYANKQALTKEVIECIEEQAECIEEQAECIEEQSAEHLLIIYHMIP